ncbi:hypothetical protein OSB04_004241 [Centaurea solstitialis]|uniref:Morc S5 domain-containing protein n=1 Tax=Centaurea solstitialis TaxID=347529 RepID=A0AA38TWF5_9ASTR|nr:hypothetical protein OSB04_004241 [Centaurea solstitialis]
MDLAEIFRDNGDVELDLGDVKLEGNGNLGGVSSHQKRNFSDGFLTKKSKVNGVRQEADENRSSSGVSALDQARSPVDDASLCSTSPICAAPLCRQFWKAGAYNDDLIPKSTTKSGSSYLHIHPKFLHSNATSHKWAFGAIAELIDNAVDEIEKGAEYVIIDKVTNPRNGSTALLIQDGNGFKTSTMRLGADVIVFSRHLSGSTLTQSIGLLSYTFLTRAGYDRIVVPMLHYQYNFVTEVFDPLQSENTPNVNLSILLEWSPYSTEQELLKQFEDVGSHGTKVIIYNLWLDEDRNMELDFETDPEDICIAWDGKGKMKDGTRMATNEQHVAKRLRYSLRTYLSVLYLKLPSTFAMVLRGQVVHYHNIATDLKHTEFILYKPHSAGCVEGAVVTTIGFLKEAPNVNVHGFNIYHKNRLILPFHPVVVFADSRGRGVAGVLEANFIEPTHNKQDFEKTSVYQKLVTRLKEMTWEYWDYHCGLIGYQIKKKARPPSDAPGSTNFVHQHDVDRCVSRKNISAAGETTKEAPFVATVNSKAALYSSSSFLKPVELVPNNPLEALKKWVVVFEGVNLKRKPRDQGERVHQLDAQMESRVGSKRLHQLDAQMECGIGSKTTTTGFGNNGEAVNVIEENKKLKAQCLEYEKSQEELNHKVIRLKVELGAVEGEYANLMSELRYLEKVKGEK